MNRAAIARAQAYFDGGGFVSDLRRRVALPSSSQEPGRAEALRTYLRDKVASAAPFWLRKLRLSLGPAFLAAERYSPKTRQVTGAKAVELIRPTLGRVLGQCRRSCAVPHQEDVGVRYESAGEHATQ